MAQLVHKNSKYEEEYSGVKPVLTGYKASAHTTAQIHSNNNNNNNNNNRKNKCLCTNPEK
jgi:hypothetical protein